MFENEIKFINDFTLNKVKELGSFITVEKLLLTDIHPSLKKYVEGEINYLIFEDRKKLIDNSLFDYSGNEISKYFDLIGTEIKKTKKISFEDIKNIILQAVSFNANYVVRPKWSLSKLIFGNNKSVSVNELQLMLSYTYYYEYLNNVFLAYLSKKKIINISVTEFELIMNKIDRELFMLHQSKLVDNALFAIADYYSIGGLNKSTIAVEAIENFLKEKNLTELLFKLKRNYTSASRKKADIDEIRKVLYSTLSVDSPFVEEGNGDEIPVDEKHFENPLKEEFIPDETLEELQNDSEESTQFDLEKTDNSDVFESEEGDSVVTQENLDKVEENVEQIQDAPPDDKSLENYEPEKTILEEEIVGDDNSDTIVDEVSELQQESNESSESEIDLIQSEESELTFSDSTEPTSTDDEKVLASLTEEISNDKEDEIIILDEKEQEDLLNFYDNELEISIEDDLSTSSEERNELNIDDNPDSELDNLEFEHELHISDEPDDAVPLEKVDFVKDLAGEEDEQEKTDDDDSEKTFAPKRTEDIFIYLSKKEIDRIIKNLFNSDSEDFANTVEKMAACNNVEEANNILENIFKYARIKPHSRDAAALTRAVEKYFN